MFCSNCGHKIEENSRFCENCGSPVDTIPDLEKKIMKHMEDELIFEMTPGTEGADTYRQKEEPPLYEPIPVRKKETGKKQKSKKPVIIGVVLTAVLVIGLAVGAFIVSSPVNRLKESVRDRDWVKAESVYEKSFRGRDRKEEKADEIFAGAVAAIESEFRSGALKYEAASRHLNQLSGFWNDGRVKDALENIRDLKDSKDAYEEAEACMEREDYEGAIEKYGQVIESDENYKEAGERLKTAKSKYREKVLSDSQGYEEKKDYDSAASTVEEALEIMPGDQVLKERLENLKKNREAYEIRTALGEAEAYADRENYYSAMELIRTALETNPGSSGLLDALKRYGQKYEEDILKKAEEALGEEKNYSAALIVLDHALSSLDGAYPEIEQSLKNKREEYVRAQLDQSAEDNVVQALLGVWHGVRALAGGTEMTADEFFVYSGSKEKNFRLEFYDDGSCHMDVPGKRGDGTWVRNKNSEGEYLLETAGVSYQIQLDGKGELKMDLDGAVLTFKKES